MNIITPVARMIGIDFETQPPAPRPQTFTFEVKLPKGEAEKIMRLWRQLDGRERAPLQHVYSQWDTDENGDEREVFNGNMRIVRNRRRMRVLKRRGVELVELGMRNADGRVTGPRAWAWFVEDTPKQKAKLDRRFKCVDCRVDTSYDKGIGEYYMVHDGIWLQAGMAKPSEWGGDGMLCIGCLEKRIGRTLKPADFTPLPINQPTTFYKSDRLLDRLGYVRTVEGDETLLTVKGIDVPAGTKPYGEGLHENMVVTEAMREFNGERYNKW